MFRKILSLYLAIFMMAPAIVLAEETETFPDYVVLPIEAGDIVPFDGVLLSLDAAAKIVTEKKFEDSECDLRIGYELHMQEERYQLQLDYKDIEISSLKDKYESMMILKVAENDRLAELVLKQKPAQGPLLVALGFGVGTLTSLGIFALSTEIVKSE
jgi:tRNA A-37 threonylcarbamoyl transferase component Bud32